MNDAATTAAATTGVSAVVAGRTRASSRAAAAADKEYLDLARNGHGERRIVRHCYGRAGRRYYRLRVRVAHDHDGTSIHGIERYAQGEHARDAGTLFRPIDRFSNIHRLRPFIVNCGHCTKNGDRKYSICKILYYPHTNYDIIKPDENHALFPSGWKH